MRSNLLFLWIHTILSACVLLWNIVSFPSFPLPRNAQQQQCFRLSIGAIATTIKHCLATVPCYHHHHSSRRRRSMSVGGVKSLGQASALLWCDDCSLSLAVATLYLCVYSGVDSSHHHHHHCCRRLYPSLLSLHSRSIVVASSFMATLTAVCSTDSAVVWVFSVSLSVLAAGHASRYGHPRAANNRVVGPFVCVKANQDQYHHHRRSRLSRRDRVPKCLLTQAKREHCSWIKTKQESRIDQISTHRHLRPINDSLR